ncbi:alpha/beta hydrolase [Synechocystis salina LEGE 06099]|nr:alpha/beta hydrolase [Synechocystis salina LEGE 06099]
MGLVVMNVRFPHFCLGLIFASLVSGAGALPLAAAERVVLTYSVLRESVSIEELGELSRTGKVSPSLKAYLKMANKDPEELRGWLNQPFQADPVTLSRVLNSFAGEYVLNQVGQVIHTPSKRDNKEALRGAIITSAEKDNQVRLIEVLENYPTPELHVNGDRLMELYQQVEGLTAMLGRLPF